METKQKIKATAKARILIYGEGKTPGEDKPDKVIEGENFIIGGKNNGLDKRSV